MTHGRRRSGRALAAGLLGLALAGAPTAASAAPAQAQAALEQLRRVQELAELDRAGTSAPVEAAAVLGPSLERGQTLRPGDSLVSPSGRFSLVMVEDGTLELREAPNRLNPGTYATPLLSGLPGSRLVLQGDGNVVLYAPDGSVQADLETAGSTARSLRVQDDGNVVLYGVGSEVVFDFGSNAPSYLLPGGTLLPGEQLVSFDGGTRLVMQGDGNLVLYTGGTVRFASGTRTPGAAAVLQEDGNFVVYGPAGRALFSTGTRDDDGFALLTVEDREFRVQVAEGDEIVTGFGSAWGSSTVEPGMALVPGDRRTAPGGVVLVLQADGNLVEYVAGRPVFATRTTDADVAIMQPDGNFVLYRFGDSEGDDPVTAVFDTRTAGNPGSRLVVQADANVVVYSPAGRALFATRR